MKIYSTSDLYLAAFLATKKCVLEQLTVENTKEFRITFKFKDTREDGDDLIKAYHARTRASEVVAKEMVSFILDVKNQIFDIKRNIDKKEKENENVNERANIKQ